jgi:hypothetical protein
MKLARFNRLWLFVGFTGLAGCSNFNVARRPASELDRPGLTESDGQSMNLARLKAKAFAQCQIPFVAPVIVPIAVLDPPKGGGHDSIGMVYQEELAVKTSNLLDQEDFYFSPRPRAAVNSIPMNIFIDTNHSGFYKKKSWESANPDFSASEIQPAIARSDIPPEGRVLTEIIVGHRSPDGDYPQLFDIRSSGYVRFAGYPPQITGASMRLAAHKIFGLEKKSGNSVKEDFPIIRSIFASVKNAQTANALVLVESQLFCGALSLDMTEGKEANILVDGYWFTRDDYKWHEDPHTGLAVFSSMFWKSVQSTQDQTSDAAHDSDQLVVKSKDGVVKTYVLRPPAAGLSVSDLTLESQTSPTEWSLVQQDHDPAHYAKFEPALGKSNYNFRVSYRIELLESNIKTGVTLYQQATDGEYGDNVVAASTIRQDIMKAKTAEQFVHFKYRTTAF